MLCAGLVESCRRRCFLACSGGEGVGVSTGAKASAGAAVLSSPTSRGESASLAGRSNWCCSCRGATVLCRDVEKEDYGFV